MTATSTEIAHGRYRSYTVKGCRCPKCRTAMSRYNKRRAMLIASGEWQPWADAEPVRRHVAALRAAGLSWVSIATKAGVAHTNVLALATSDRPRVRASFAAKLMNVTVDERGLLHLAKVDAAGTRRRVQALVYVGWSITLLADRIGVDRSTLHNLMGQDQVRAYIARAVRRLFEELRTENPPATTRYERTTITRARNLARARGWVSVMAWDNIDDPDEKPRGVPATPEQLHAALDEARTRRGMTWREVSAELSTHRDIVREMRAGQAPDKLRARVETWLGDQS